MPGVGYAYGPYVPAAPPPKKRHIGLWILGGVGAVILLCCGIGLVSLFGGDERQGDTTTRPVVDESATTSPGATPAAPNPAPEEQLPGLNTAVRDGKFEFTVTSVTCGQSRVGSDLLGEDADGQLCLVDLTVKNIGDQPQTMFDDNQRAFAANGNEFGTDSVAALYANDNNDVFINEINPGNQISGRLVFDIPKDTSIAKLRLHDSAFSNGVEVQV